jgi:hypothetical protein
MKAACHDFVYEKNTDWDFSIGYNSGNAGDYSPVNITGFKAEFKLYLNRYSEPVLTLSTIDNKITLVPASGQIQFTITKAINNTYAAKELYYTLDITDTQLKTIRILKGSIKIEI